MDIRRQSVSIALLVWALTGGASALTKVIAQGDDFFGRGERTLQLVTGSAQARRIAQERYRFVRWFGSNSGTFPLLGTEASYSTVMFPVGRSDRAYVFLLPDDWRGKEVNSIFCYQRKDGKDRMVYRVNLEQRDSLATRDRPARRAAPIMSLLDFVTREIPVRLNGAEHVKSYAVRGGISQFAKNDLALRRDYVGYRYYFGVDALEVSLLSGRQGGNPYLASGVWYDLERDPFTKAEFRNGSDGFYRKYGLPAAQGELALISGGTLGAPNAYPAFGEEQTSPSGRSGRVGEGKTFSPP